MKRRDITTSSFRFLLLLTAADMIQSSMVDEHRLIHDLLHNYEPNVRPYMNISEPVQTSFGVSLIRILGLDQESEVLDTFLQMKQSWHDVRLRWDASEYGGITELRLPSAGVWKPDIVPFDSVDRDPHTSYTTSVMVVNSGHVVWILPVRMRTTCQVDLRHFPFDEQKCTMHFGSWNYDGRQINLTSWGGNESTAFVVEPDAEIKEWTLLKHDVAIRYLKHDCCKEPLPDLRVTLTLKRNPSYYVHVFIVPAVLLGLLVPFHLLLPPSSCERMTLGSILLASLLLLILHLQDVLPNAHSELPAIGLFYTLNLVWVSLAMLSSILVLNLHSRGPRSRKVPDTIRWIFLRTLNQLVCLDFNAYSLLNDSETITMQGLECPKSSMASPSVPSSDSRQSRTMGADVNPNVNVKLEQDVEEISRQLHALGARARMRESRAEVLNEWQLVALVLDRVLFVIFFVIYLLCALIVLA